MDTSNASCSCLCKGIQGKQSNRRVVSELLIGQSFTQLWHMKSLIPSQVMTIGTQLWEWLSGGELPYLQAKTCGAFGEGVDCKLEMNFWEVPELILLVAWCVFSEMVALLLRCYWGCVRMWFNPQSAQRHSETRGLGTGNFHVRCEPRLSCGVENFNQYYAIPVNEKTKCIQLTKCRCHLPPYPSGSYGAGGERSSFAALACRQVLW